MSSTPPVLHLVSPDSLSAWFGHFADVRPDDVVLQIGEQPVFDVGHILGALDGRDVVIHSSHDTLSRDRRLADSLLVLGHRVSSQSHACVVLGTDKLLMKEFLSRNGFRTPRWAGPGEALPGGAEHLVVKSRHGTQSVGTRLGHRSGGPVGEGEFCESYHAGTEYSVIAYRDAGRVVTFPPIWKGRTSLSLVPPWRRLRLCPYTELDAGLENDLRETAVSIAEASEAIGHVEIEYLVTDEGAVTVLEINPRVSGTMRLAAMATGLPIFSLDRQPQLAGALPAVRWAAETPYQGEHFSQPAEGAFATSRLTVSSDDPAELRGKLLHFGGNAVSAGPVGAAQHASAG